MLHGGVSVQYVLIMELARFRNAKVVGSTPIIGHLNQWVTVSYLHIILLFSLPRTYWRTYLAWHS